MATTKLFNDSRAKFTNNNPVNMDFDDNSFSMDDIKRILGSSGLKSGAALWYRLGCPIGVSNFMRCMAIAPEGTDHRRQGWMMGLCYLSAKVESKDNTYRRSAKLQRAYASLTGYMQEFAACILTPLVNRSPVLCNKYGENQQIGFPTALISNELKQWLLVAWPSTFVDDGHNQRAAVNPEFKHVIPTMQPPVVYTQTSSLFTTPLRSTMQQPTFAQMPLPQQTSQQGSSALHQMTTI